MENMKNKISETTKILMDEHKNILKVANALEKECEEIKNGKRVNDEFLRKVIDFIRNYADKFHHAKEEDILFKEMCKSSVQEKLHCNPIEQMLKEHNLGRNFIKGIEEGMKERFRQKVVENALGYVQLIKEHIYKEDNVLYPMGDEALDKVILKSMLDKFKKIEEERRNEKQKHLRFIKELQIK